MLPYDSDELDLLTALPVPSFTYLTESVLSFRSNNVWRYILRSFDLNRLVRPPIAAATQYRFHFFYDTPTGKSLVDWFVALVIDKIRAGLCTQGCRLRRIKWRIFQHIHRLSCPLIKEEVLGHWVNSRIYRYRLRNAEQSLGEQSLRERFVEKWTPGMADA